MKIRNPKVIIHCVKSIRFFMVNPISKKRFSNNTTLFWKFNMLYNNIFILHHLIVDFRFTFGTLIGIIVGFTSHGFSSLPQTTCNKFALRMNHTLILSLIMSCKLSSCLIVWLSDVDFQVYRLGNNPVRPSMLLSACSDNQIIKPHYEPLMITSQQSLTVGLWSPISSALCRAGRLHNIMCEGFHNPWLTSQPIINWMF